MARERFEIDVIGRDQASGVFGRIKQSFAGIAETAMGFVAGNFITKGLDSITGGLRNLAGSAFESVAAQEELGMALQGLYAVELSAAAGMNEVGEANLSMSEALAQAAPKAEELLGWMREIAIASPFGEDTVKQTFQQAVGYGMTADKARELTDALVNYAAGSGKSNEQTKMLGFALGQVFAKGKLVGEEMRQLTNAGFGVSTMARALGMDVGELSEQMKDGQISADMVIDAFVRMSSNDFPNAAKRMSTSMGGLKSTLEDIKQYVLRDVFTPFFKSLTPVLESMVDVVTSSDFSARLQEWGAAFGEFAAGVMEGAGKVINVFATLVDAGFGSSEMWEALSAVIGDEAIPVLMGVGDAITGLVATAREHLTSLQGVFTEAWGAIVAVVPTVQEHFTALAESLSGVWQNIVSVVSEAVPVIRDVVLAVFGVIRDFLAAHGDEIMAVLQQAWQTILLAINTVVAAVRDVILPAFRDIAAFIKAHGVEIQAVLSAAWSLIRGVIEAALKIIQTILGAAMAAMKGDWSEAWRIIQEGVGQAWQRIRQAVEDGIRYLRSIDLASIGRNIVDSLASGIRSAAEAVVGALRGVVDGAVSAVKRRLGIESPSKVFMAMGVSVGEGFTQGILSQRRVIQGAFDEIAQVRLPTFDMQMQLLRERMQQAQLAAVGVGGGRQVGMGRTNNYTLNVTSTVPTERLVLDFGLLRSVAGR